MGAEPSPRPCPKFAMDAVRNPYAPGAGTPPPELAGRSDVIRSGTVALQRIAIGRPAQSLIMVGLRGVGKTVLLNKLREVAEVTKYKATLVEAHEGKSLPPSCCCQACARSCIP